MVPAAPEEGETLMVEDVALGVILGGVGLACLAGLLISLDEHPTEWAVVLGIVSVVMWYMGVFN
jgi:hypothetical protein